MTDRTVQHAFPELDAHPWRLRKFSLSDMELIRKASTDPYIPLVTSIPAVFSETEAVAYIKRQWSRHDDGIGYSFAIAAMDTDNAVGSVYVGLHDIKDGRATIGYWIIEEHRGKGIAKAVLKRAAHWSLSELQIPRVELYVEPWNIISIKVAESAGFVQEGLMRSWQNVGGQRKDMIMMSVLNPA